MSEAYEQRMAIYEICKDYEWKHRPSILITVDPGLTRYKWIINMISCGFNNRGEFSKEAHRIVIFGRKNLKKQVLEVLDDMFYELYESR